MSKYTEIEIKLVPVYGSGGFRSAFPRLAEFLKTYGYQRALEKEQDLFHLVDVLTRAINDPAIPGKAKAPLARLHERIKKTRDEAREQLLGRHLNELDQTLYRLEDLFNDLEKEFSW